MSIEALDYKLKVLGVPSSQAHQLQKHIKQAERFVFPRDPGLDESISWLSSSLFQALEPKDAHLVYKIVAVNKPDPGVEYLEQGYDSCQSHRKLSKVAAEAILIGGLTYESSLLGNPMDLKTVQKEIGSTINVDTSDWAQLTELAKKHGSKQDFLFPGVTPSSANTPSLEELAFLVLKGTPSTTVRSLTGVGGLRYDKDWNYATDLATFVDLKVAEDKRYYPGIGIFYFLMRHELESIPVIIRIKQSQSGLYFEIAKFVAALKRTKKQEFSGVSILCSAYLPDWSEMKGMQEFLSDGHIELAESFHSPSYEFATLRFIFEQVNNGETVHEATYNQLSSLAKKLDYCWSFNSTIHLPWTAELAGLSNDYIGSITNQLGDHCTRYGVGYKGKSLEVREYSFGSQRHFPYGLTGKKAYGVKIYHGSDHFTGSHDALMLSADKPLLCDINRHGFMRAALNYLAGISHD